MMDFKLLVCTLLLASVLGGRLSKAAESSVADNDPESDSFRLRGQQLLEPESYADLVEELSSFLDIFTEESAAAVEESNLVKNATGRTQSTSIAAHLIIENARRKRQVPTPDVEQNKGPIDKIQDFAEKSLIKKLLKLALKIPKMILKRYFIFIVTTLILIALGPILGPTAAIILSILRFVLPFVFSFLFDMLTKFFGNFLYKQYERITGDFSVTDIKLEPVTVAPAPGAQAA